MGTTSRINEITRNTTNRKGQTMTKQDKLWAAIQLVDNSSVREWAIRNSEAILEHHTFPEKETAYKLSNLLIILYLG